MNSFFTFCDKTIRSPKDHTCETTISSKYKERDGNLVAKTQTNFDNIEHIINIESYEFI